MNKIKTFLIKRITELSTYAGLLLILSPSLPFSLLFFIGILLLCIGDATIQNLIKKVAPALEKFIDSV